MVAFLYRMPSGISGDVSRPSQSTIESGILDSGFPFASYGIPVKRVSGKIRPVASGDAAGVIIGLLVRPFPTGASQDPLGTSTPPTTGVGNVMRRGYMTVVCNAGTPADGGQVFVRVGNASGVKVIGGVEAAAESTSVSAANAGNTGNGTMGATTTQANAQNGAYSVVFTSATKFEVYDPTGKLVGQGATGTAFLNQIGFTITAGATAFASGDGFAVTVTANTQLIPGAVFRNAGDASGNVEIEYNL